MRLVYNLSESARRKIFVETGADPGQVQALEFEPAELSVEQRALLAEWNQHLESHLTLRYQDTAYVGTTTKVLEQDGVVSDPAALIAAYRDVQLAARGRVDAQEAENIAAEIERFQSWSLATEPGILNTGMYQRSPRRQEWIDAHAEATKKADAIRTAALLVAAEANEKAAAEKARRLAERAAWAAEHGSARLRKCVEGGYDCQRLYVIERAALEYPGYSVDFADKAAWRERSGPSEAALDEAKRVDGEVVWMTLDVDGASMREYGADGVEAVTVANFLGKYDLVKRI